jgi:PleD family two-component response regulator
MSAPHEVLIVDDNETNRLILGGSLSRAGYRLLEAKDGVQAIAVALASQPDLILLDIAMPGRDGFEVCEVLKREQATADIPVIFVTSKDHPGEVAKAFALGASDYITKPFHVTEVKARIAVHLRLLSALRNSRGVGAHSQQVDGLVGVTTELASAVEANVEEAKESVGALASMLEELLRITTRIRALDLSDPERPGAGRVQEAGGPWD